MSEHNNEQIFNNKSTFTRDVEFMKDVYIYGTLYYDFPDSLGFGGTSIITDDITVNDFANINNLYVSGVSTFAGPVGINSDLLVTGVSTFTGPIDATDLDIDNIDVGIATVRELFELRNDDGTLHLVGFADGPRAGSVGIGSTLPDRSIDVDDIRILTHIFDSSNNQGGDGYYLSRDAVGVRWVQAAPDAQTDGFFVKNEGVLVGVGSYTTMNFIGNVSGGDLVHASQNGSIPTQVDVTIVDHWVKNNSGLHTTVNVGINQQNPSVPLDVNGAAIFRTSIEVEGTSQFDDVAMFNNTVEVDDAEVRVHNQLIVGTATTTLFAVNAGIVSFARIAGFATVAGFATNAARAGLATYSDFAGVSTYSDFSGIATVAFAASFANLAGVATIAGFATDAGVAGFATFSGIAGFATFSSISGFATDSEIAGFATFAGRSAFSTFSETAGFATVAGFVTNAARAGIATFIETVETLTNQDFFIPFVENSVSTGIETVRVDAGIRYNPNSNKLTLDGELELNSSLRDVNNIVADPGVGQTDYRLASVGTGVSWRPAGVETKNILYVTKNGNDNNTGLLEGDAKATIGGACAAAQDGDTIYVRPGTYFEDNPIGLRTDVSISGQDLRLVTVVPNNPAEDLFHVRRGCLIENMNFAGNSVAIAYTGAMVAFPPLVANQNSGYVAAGPANEGPSGRWRSPYVRNCTNFASDSIGMRIDGNHADAAFTGTNNLGQDLKSMVVDAYTQYNQNGIGVSITNSGYAQLVSIFTINCKIAIFTKAGGQCDLTNSNSSFGNFGLFADGTSDDEFTGITTGTKIADEDTYQVFGVRDTLSNVRKPFDGQGSFFKLNLDNYPDTGTKSGIVTEPLRTIREIRVTNGGSGYSQSAPPAVTVSGPLGPEGILAELSANVSAAGTVSSVDIIASGRNFLPPGSGSNQQDIVISFTGTGGATAEAITDPILFTVDRATEPNPTTGLSTVTFNEFVPYSVGTGVSMSFRRLSRIITSSHSFEYVGAGTDINRANPFQGGEPIPENEIVAINGGQIPFTSTDQKGNFRIGQGLVIDQTTSTISGRDFNRAIQANLTPLILALGG